jgi:hypothetical protein
MRPIQKPVVRRCCRKAYRVFADIRLRFSIDSLQKRNMESTESILGLSPAVVSMTSYGSRVDEAFLAIESIGRGRMRPARFVLWLDDPQTFHNLPVSLKRLVARGLEVKLSKNLGPHTKYYPAVVEGLAGNHTLVTADDDIVVPRFWLDRLMKVSNRTLLDVVCYRAHRVGIDSGGLFTSYSEWGECWTTEPSLLNFATGVSGVAYSPRFVEIVKRRGTKFMQLCPNADDVWLHKVAVENNVKIGQVFSIPMEFPVVPGSQDSGLYHSNVSELRNDMQIKNTYDLVDVARISRLVNKTSNSKQVEAS